MKDRRIPCVTVGLKMNGTVYHGNGNLYSTISTFKTSLSDCESTKCPRYPNKRAIPSRNENESQVPLDITPTCVALKVFLSPPIPTEENLHSLTKF